MLFLLACLCELHRIRIVQAEMGLAGSRTSFSPNRKPSFLSAIFCICHHVCPLVHPILPVTAFGWQFLYRGCVFVVTVFLLSNFSGFAALRTTAFTSERRVAGDCTPGNSVQNENGTEIGEAHYGNVDSQLHGKEVHYKKLEQVFSISGKNNTTGIMLRPANHTTSVINSAKGMGMLRAHRKGQGVQG